MKYSFCTSLLRQPLLLVNNVPQTGKNTDVL